MRERKGDSKIDKNGRSEDIREEVGIVNNANEWKTIIESNREKRKNCDNRRSEVSKEEGEIDKKNVCENIELRRGKVNGESNVIDIEKEKRVRT